MQVRLVPPAAQMQSKERVLELPRPMARAPLQEVAALPPSRERAQASPRAARDSRQAAVRQESMRARSPQPEASQEAEQAREAMLLPRQAAPPLARELLPRAQVQMAAEQGPTVQRQHRWASTAVRPALRPSRGSNRR